MVDVQWDNSKMKYITVMFGQTQYRVDHPQIDDHLWLTKMFLYLESIHVPVITWCYKEVALAFPCLVVDSLE